MPPASVESFCNLLARSRLLAPDKIRAARQRWLVEAKEADAADVAQFARWLTANQYVTDYQAGLLLRGRADRFFLNDYKLLERIGAGRMAGIYKAVHRLGQVVAIKVLPPSKAKEPQALARFQREARLALRLKHPHVVRTIEMGEGEGLHYIVMEYLDGETLAEVLKRRGKLPLAEVVRLVHQALLGLQCLHEEGVVHRDIKPANLMLVPGVSPPKTGKKGSDPLNSRGLAPFSPFSGRPDNTLQAVVKILDVGVGRALFDEGPPGAGKIGELTDTGEVLGTPEYMAPEQAWNAKGADVRADIYSLGCVFYHALAGKPPFPTANLIQHLLQPSSQPARRLKEVGVFGVPDELQFIVDTMMAKDPALRYPTPDRAARALAAFVI